MVKFSNKKRGKSIDFCDDSHDSSEQKAESIGAEYPEKKINRKNTFQFGNNNTDVDEVLSENKAFNKYYKQLKNSVSQDILVKATSGKKEYLDFESHDNISENV